MLIHGCVGIAGCPAPDPAAPAPERVIGSLLDLLAKVRHLSLTVLDLGPESDGDPVLERAPHRRVPPLEEHAGPPRGGRAHASRRVHQGRYWGRLRRLTGLP